MPLDISQTKTRTLIFGAVFTAATVLSSNFAAAGAAGIAIQAIGGIAGNIGANDLGDWVKCFRQKQNILDDPHLTLAVGSAIGLVIFNIVECDDELPKLVENNGLSYPFDSLRKLAKNTEKKWVKLSKKTITDSNYIDIHESHLVTMFANDVQNFHKIKALDIATWKEILRWLASESGVSLHEDVINYVAQKLYDEFPQRFRDVLKHNADNGGEAFAQMLLNLHGKALSALEEVLSGNKEIIKALKEIATKKDVDAVFSTMQQSFNNTDNLIKQLIDSTTKIDITNQEILKEIQKISQEVQDACKKTSSDSKIANTIASKRRQLKKLRELLNNLEEKEIEYSLTPIVEIRENKQQINKRTEEIHQEIQYELKNRSPLPPQRFSRFVGRQNDFNNIFNTLKDFNNNSHIVAIDGIGGVGKTALTREIVNNSLSVGFYSVVWESAKPEEFSGGVTKTVNNANINFEGLLTQIGSKLGYVEVHNIRSLEDKRKFVHEILGEERYLVVIDNLETLEGYRELVNNLEDLFTNSKAILTTRHLISGVRHIKPFSLQGFEENESCEFLKIYASERPRANEIISAVNQNKLVEIHKLTGGIPLAMELVVGQLEQGYSLRRVVQELKSVNYGAIQNRESDENIYKQFYKFIYLNSWEELSDEEQDLLICIGEFDLSEGATIDDLIDIAELKAAQVEDITAKLIQLSLVKRYGIEDEQTFFLHPLTHLFVQQQLEEE
ncbi:MAG: NB-ARC domain-containing protein [Cyanobacteria bacterium J06629_18]